MGGWVELKTYHILSNDCGPGGTCHAPAQPPPHVFPLGEDEEGVEDQVDQGD